jgi:hypothetical protein
VDLEASDQGDSDLLEAEVEEQEEGLEICSCKGRLVSIFSASRRRGSLQKARKGNV